MRTKLMLALCLLLLGYSSHSQMPDFLNTEPTWSPDGEKILFISRRDGNGEVYVMKKDGSSPTRLTFTNQRESAPRWSPDGKEILFNSERTGINQIFKMKAEGSEQTNLTNSSVPEYQGVWSPLGDKISFTSLRDANAQVYIMNADGTDQKNLAKTKTNVSSAAWSPDNKFIMCTSVQIMPNNIEDLKIDLTQGKQETLFKNTKKPCHFLDWFKDGTGFFYKMSTIFSPTESNDEIYSTDLGFSTNQRIQKGMLSVVSAKLSPKGDRLLIESNSTVYILLVGDGNKPFKLGKNFHSPEWSPDGNSVVMVSSGSKMNIYTINIDGTNLTQLTK